MADAARTQDGRSDVPAWVALPSDAAGDDAFRDFARRYASAMPDAQISHWGTVALAPDGSGQRFATLCWSTDSVAYLIEWHARAWIFEWGANTAPPVECRGANDSEELPAEPSRWERRRDHELVAERVMHRFSALLHIGVRRGQLAVFDVEDLDRQADRRRHRAVQVALAPAETPSKDAFERAMDFNAPR